MLQNSENQIEALNGLNWGPTWKGEVRLLLAAFVQKLYDLTSNSFLAGFNHIVRA